MRSVTIVEVTAEPLSVPTVDPFVIASGEVRATRSVLVTAKIRSKFNEDATGLAEAACLPPVTAEDQPHTLEAVRHAAEQLHGRRIDDLDALRALLDRALHGHPVARSGIEVALLDAIARVEKKPLHAFLSGKSESVAPIDTDITIPILAPERMATLAREWWARGFRSLKIKVGRDVNADLRALSAMVQAVPQAKFRPDANAGLSVSEALTFVREAKALNAHLELFEQPCKTAAELKELADQWDLPVIADESAKSLAEVDALLSSKSCDGINLKVAKFGSLLKAREAGLMAQKAGLKVMVGGMVESRLGMTAATHLAASLGHVDYADLDTAWLLAEERFSGGYEGTATYTLPATPGLGVQKR